MRRLELRRAASPRALILNRYRERCRGVFKLMHGARVPSNVSEFPMIRLVLQRGAFPSAWRAAAVVLDQIFTAVHNVGIAVT